MDREIWKPGNMIYPIPAVMVTCMDNNGKSNIITVAWTGTVCTNPSMAYISVKPERYSYELIKNTKEFVINLTTKSLVKATDYCGVRSGRDVDKFKETGLTPCKSNFVDVPYIAQAPVAIECKVREIITLGSHDMFLADVMGVNVDKKYMDSANRFCLQNAEPIVYSHGEYYEMGKKLGTFGYSVKKPVKKRARK